MLKISVLPGKKPSCPPLTAGDLRHLSLSLSLSLSQRGPSALGGAARWRVICSEGRDTTGDRKRRASVE